jgi:hypothetical protein
VVILLGGNMLSKTESAKTGAEYNRCTLRNPSRNIARSTSSVSKPGSMFGSANGSELLRVIEPPIGRPDV